MNYKILYPYLLSLIASFWPLSHGPNWGLHTTVLFFFFFWFRSIKVQTLQIAKHLANLFSIQFLLSALIYESLNLISLIGPIFWLTFYLISLIRHTKQDLSQPVYRKSALLIFLSFVLQGFSYPPYLLGPLAVVSLVPWLYTLSKLPINTGLRLTFWCAIPGQLILFYWIVNVVQAGYVLAIGGGLFLLLAWLAGFQVLLALAFYLFKQRNLIWIWPLFATGLEVFRTWGDISFPWTPIAACFGSHLSLLQITAWIGASGLSLLIYTCNLLVVKGLIHKQKLLFISPILLLLVSYSWGTYSLSKTPTPTKNLTAILIQPNQDQRLKWDPNHFTSLMQKMWNLTSQADLHQADLIVFPETSIPNFVTRSDQWPYLYDSLAHSINTPIFMGILDYEYDETQPHSAYVFNKGFLMDPRFENWVSYIKVKLVPFSEALPFGRIFPMINFVDLGEGDFHPGPGAVTYTTNNIHWSPNICYEIIYPEYVRKQIELGSELMVEITNDGWFGKSSQLGQHLNLVKLRAVENGIPVIRSTNTGITAALDAQGRVLAELPTHQENFLKISVPIQSKPSFYSTIGNWIEGILAWGILTLICTLLFQAIWRKIRLFQQN